MTVDADLVTRKMLLVASDLDALQAIASKPLDGYLASRIDQVVAERYLERMIGRMIDINYHVITESGHPPPSDYYVSFLRLAEVKVLDTDFAGRIAASAGLRNRLVHEYNELDQRKIYDAVHSALRDVPTYLARIKDYLDRV